MTDITDRTHQPDIREIDEYIGSPLFAALKLRMEKEFKPLYSVEYSRDKVLPGWNLRFYKAGRTLCRLYPRRGCFAVLVVVGRREKERAEELMPEMCDEMRRIYAQTREGMGQRWLLIELHDTDALYEDVIRIIGIRRTGR